MEDPTAYNVTNEAGQFLCPVCGWRAFPAGPAYGHHGGMIGSGFCCCCLFEPGYDDSAAASGFAGETIIDAIRLCRAKWIAEGMPWKCGISHHEPCPKGWNPSEQLDNLLGKYPHLAD